MTIPWDKYLPRHCAHEPEPLYPRHASLPVEMEPLDLGPGSTVWVCPDCAFSFLAEHFDPDGGHSCPSCGEMRLTEELADAKAQLAVIRNAALEEAALEADDYLVGTGIAAAIRALKTPLAAAPVVGGGE